MSDKLEVELPSEFECCYCTIKDFKDFTDAEDSMPLPTSDLRLPVCMEMKKMNDREFMEAVQAPPVPPLPALRQRPASEPQRAGDRAAPPDRVDHGSVDSTDTFASCHTHPFLSEGDLADGIPDHMLDTNLYVNPLDGGTAEPGRVKKSASGDTSLRSLGVSPMDESYPGFGQAVRGSRGSLNDSQLPKHRKARFQGVKPFRDEATGKEGSEESLEGKKKKLFPTGKSLATATKIFNQHLLGLQSFGSIKHGKQSDSRSSLSESGDSRNSPNMEVNRRSKSILKKSDPSHYQFSTSSDPETEKLLSDSASVHSGCGSHSSPQKLPPLATRGASSLVRQQACHSQGIRGIGPKASKAVSRPQPIKFVGLPADEGEARRPQLKSPLLPLENWWGGEKHAMDEAVSENRHKERLELHASADVSGCSSREMAPIYICPPPPLMDDSPTEETKLIGGPRVVPGS